MSCSVVNNLIIEILCQRSRPVPHFKRDFDVELQRYFSTG
jgi:hypothetical protein